MAQREWWHDHREIAALIRYLEEDGRLDPTEVAYLVEKPWKWTDEYERMQKEEAAITPAATPIGEAA